MQTCRRRNFKNHILKKAAFKVNRRKRFFTQYIIKPCNSLSQDAVEAKTIHALLKGQKLFQQQ